MASSVMMQDRRRERALIVERDPVVGLADFQAAVVVRADAGRQRGIDDVVDALDDAGAHLVDALFVEADDERRDRAIVGDQIAANEIVFRARRLMSAGSLRFQSIQQRPDIEAVVGNGVDNRGGRQAGDALDRVDALDVAGHVLDEPQRLAREESSRPKSALSATISDRVPPNSSRKRS